MKRVDLSTIISEGKPITLKEAKDIIYNMKADAFDEVCKRDPLDRNYQWYNGEVNAFYCVLDLLDLVPESKEAESETV